MDATVSSDLFRIIKTEPVISDTVNGGLVCKEDYEQEIVRLRKSHDEQIVKLCQELEQSSVLIHQMKFELDSARVTLNQKEKQLQAQTQFALIEDLRNQNKELTNENSKLKRLLIDVTNRYQMLFNDVQDAREYLLNLMNQ